MHHREIDVLPQLDIWPGPDCTVSDPQRGNLFIRRLPLHIIYLLVFFTMGWVVLLVSILFLEPAYIFSKSAIQQQFVITQEKEPPRLEENTADMISRRLRYAPTMLSFWWAVWVSLLIYGAFIGPAMVESTGVPLALPGLVWFGLWLVVKDMRDDRIVFQYFPWMLFVSWVLGIGAAIVSIGGSAPQMGYISGSFPLNPFAGFVVFFGIVFGIAFVVVLNLSKGK